MDNVGAETNDSIILTMIDINGKPLMKDTMAIGKIVQLRAEIFGMYKFIVEKVYLLRWKQVFKVCIK